MFDRCLYQKRFSAGLMKVKMVHSEILHLRPRRGSAIDFLVEPCLAQPGWANV